MTNPMPTESDILARLAIGPTPMLELAGPRFSKSKLRPHVRLILQSLRARGLAVRVFINEFPYWILDTPAGRRQALQQAIDEMTVRSPDGCLLWRGRVQDDGRGPPMTEPGGGRRNISAKRVIWAMNKRKPLTRNDIIRMRCGDDRCVEISHMTLTPRNINQRGQKFDLMRRMRMAEAARARHAKIPGIEAARAIRASTEPDATLADRYGVCVDTIRDCRAGRTWQELPTGIFSGLLIQAAQQQAQQLSRASQEATA